MDILTYKSFQEASATALAYLHRVLGFQLWAIGLRQHDNWVVVQSHGQGFGLENGSTIKWEDTICSRMAHSARPAFTNAIDTIPAYAEAPFSQKFGVQAYIGVPLANDDGEILGTLCAMDSEHQSVAVEPQLPLIELLSQLLATILTTELDAVKHADIAEQMKSERWRLAGILDGTNLASWEWNVQTGETVFNQRWAQILGYTLEEISPVSIATWANFAHPVDLEQSNLLLEKHFKGELEYYEFESRMKHKDGHWVWVGDRGKVFSWTENGEPLMMFGSHNDITESKRIELALRESEENFKRLSTIDEMTGLLNRRGWRELIAHEESRAQRYSYVSCVIVIDLDGLKTINDKLGHDAGDDLIRRTAGCIQQAVRDVDGVARLGGDEFAVLGVDCGEDGANALLERIKQAFLSAAINASWGMHCSRMGFDSALAEADRLMYRVKAQRQTPAAKD